VWSAANTAAASSRSCGLLDRDSRRLGHESDQTFAAAARRFPARLIAQFRCLRETAPDDWRLCEVMNLCRATRVSSEFDVMHSHAYLWGLPFDALPRAPILHTPARHPYEDRCNSVLAGRVPRLRRFRASSGVKLRLPPDAVIHMDRCRAIRFSGGAGRLRLLPGQIHSGQGVLKAIAAARATGLRLLLAGPAQ